MSVKDIDIVTGFVIAGFSASIGIIYGAFAINSWIAPKREEIKHNVMVIQAQPLGLSQEGEVKDLYDLKLRYESAKTNADKETIAATARYEFRIYPKDNLPADLKLFMASIGG